MLLLLSIVLFCLIASNSEARLNGEDIIGGVETNLHELKYQISFQIWEIEWCGGSIIDEKFVLTAAHCVVDEKNNFLTELPMKVVAGINDLNSKDDLGKIVVDVDKVYIPAVYNKTMKTSAADIAVVKLKQKLYLGTDSNLAKLKLPLSTEKKLSPQRSFVNSTVLVSGFGWDEVKLNPIKVVNNRTKYEEDGSSSGKLLKAKALVVSNSKCQSAYKKYVIGDGQICARIIQHPENVHQGVCSGDSGSPLVLDDIIVGLVSYNYKGCNDKRRPAVYTRISAYIAFIRNAKKNNVTADIRAEKWPTSVYNATYIT